MQTERQQPLQRFSDTRVPIVIGMDERFQQTSVGTVKDIFPSGENNPLVSTTPTDLWREQTSYADQMLESATLESLERAAIATMFVVSGHHKRALLQEATGYLDDKNVYFPIIKDLETLPEQSYNNKVIIIPDVEGKDSLYHIAYHPEVMAMTKATRMYPALSKDTLQNGEAFVQEVINHIEFWDEIASEENQHHKGINPYGQHVLSVAHDVMVYVKDAQGDFIPLHQAKKLTSKEDFLPHFEQFFSLDENGKQQGNTQMRAKDALAIHDLPAHIGGVARRQNEFAYDLVNRDYLLAYIYGIHHEAVSDKTREEFLTVWNSFASSNRDLLFAGWTPENGIDPERNRRINAGIPNQSPLFWLMRSDMHDLALSNHVIAYQKLRPMLDIVMGNPSHLVSLCRSVMVAATHQATIDAMLQSPKSQEYTKVAKAMEQEFGYQAMMPNWIDFTDSLDLLRTDAKYFQYFIHAHKIRQ